MLKVINQSYISEKGKRENNEDNCGYIPGSTFVVCDGVGGSEKGEIASEIVVKSFLNEYKSDINLEAEDVLRKAEDNLTDHIQNNPETMGMATTLTFSQVKDNGIYLAWVGDSRIYQFRQGKIVFVTTDHSWVNEALKAGIITAEEAINHPKSNIITRAVQGSHKKVEIDDVLLEDVQKDDIFLHCSDGILEAWDDTQLSKLITEFHDPEIILDKIKERCNDLSRDNFTAIVYKIEASDLVQEYVNEENLSSEQLHDLQIIEAIPVEENMFVDDYKESKPYQFLEPKKKAVSSKKTIVVLTTITCLCLISVAIFFYSNKNTNSLPTPGNIKKDSISLSKPEKIKPEKEKTEESEKELETEKVLSPKKEMDTIKDNKTANNKESLLIDRKSKKQEIKKTNNQ